ncbi:HD domain-containing protein [candidate division TA06 bacterium]|nr:HD domain-containing protein [candidate division TA06 bacterium]
MDAKDPELRQHALRVMEYSKTLAEFIQVPKATISSIKFAALLHEVGKIPEVTSSGDGFQRMTDRIVEPLKIPEKVKLILHHQSERFDGKGEPDGLKGEDIPLGSRILAIADAYDEGISSGRSEDEILEGISAFAGTQFDPLLIETLVSIRNADEEEDPDSKFESASSSDEPIQYSSQSA